MTHIIVTGSRGFIGQHLVRRLMVDGHRVTGIDWQAGNGQDDIRFPQGERFESGTVDAIVHLAALAGVRGSLEQPVDYQDVNVVGTQQVLELARLLRVPQVLFASSSSVYGANPEYPWVETAQVSPLSPYAASKAAGELLGAVYSRLYGIRFIALRFFTVYGPGQRPDLAIRKFADGMLAGKSIDLYGDGSSVRDYTHVDDIVEGITAALNLISPFEIINLGSGRPITLQLMVRTLGEALGVEPRILWRPEQPGDAPATWADITKARRLLGYVPRVRFEDGMREFASWMRRSREAA